MSVDYPLIAADNKLKDAFVDTTKDEREGLARWKREVIFAKQALDANPSLKQCDQDSVRNAIFNIALTGVSLNPIKKEAYLIPRKGRARLDISYQGLIRLITEAGAVHGIDAAVVREGDEFRVSHGTNPEIVHFPQMDTSKKITHVYAVATLPPGIKQFVVLDRKEIDKVRAMSTAKDSPWTTWEEEMCKKTAVKRLVKLLPRTERLDYAVDLLNKQDSDLSAKEGSRAEELIKQFGGDAITLKNSGDCYE